MCKSTWTSWDNVPNSPYGLCGRKATLNCSISELRSCVKVEVAVLGSPPLTVLMVSVDVKQHFKKTKQAVKVYRPLLHQQVTPTRLASR